MSTRAGPIIAVAVAVAFAVIGYGIGVWNSGNGLSRSQQAATESIVTEMMAAQQPAEDNGLTAGQQAATEKIVNEVIAAQMPAEEPATSAPAATPLTTLANLSDTQRTEFGALVRDYLMTNPEVIRDAINELQRKQEEADRAQQVAAIASNGDTIFKSEHQVVLGNPNGDVTLVEFFDYNCGFCRRAYPDIVRLMDEDPNLRVVLKEFPVLGEGSVEAARVGLAVNATAPEKYGEFFKILSTEQGQVNGETALAVAEEIGLDPEALRGMLDSPQIDEGLAEVYGIAGQLNLTGTPSFVTSQEVIVGAVGYDALKQKITEAREACTTATC